MAKAKKKWMQDAVKRPGALRAKLKVPEGENIPAKKLNKAANSSDPTLKKEAVLAKTFKKSGQDAGILGTSVGRAGGHAGYGKGAGQYGKGDGDKPQPDGNNKGKFPGTQHSTRLPSA